MRRALRWLFGVLLLGLLALAGADYLVWRWAGGMIGESYAGWRAARQAEGWVVESGAAHLTGWPFAARLVVPDFALKGGAAAMPGGVSLNLPELDLAVTLTAPSDLLITPVGTARATLGLLPPLAITAESAALHTSLAASDAASPLAGEMLRVTVRPDQTAKDAASGLSLVIARIDFLLSAPVEPPGLMLHVQAGGIDLPSAITWPFSTHIGRAGFDAGLAPLPAARGADFAATKAAWQAARGTLRLAAALTDWGGTTMSGEAKITLDDKLAPEGVGFLHLIDPDAAVASLVRQGMIADASAQALGAVLHLLAHPAPGDAKTGDAKTGDAKPEVDLPLSLAEGVVSAGGIPLFRLSQAGLSAP